MGHGDGKQTRIALLIVVAALAIALAVIEALAGQGEAPDTAVALWASHLQRQDNALRRNDVSVAVRAWHDAYVAALGSRRWEGMLAVGDAALRVGDVTRARLVAGSKARQAYLGALFRARDEQSLDGLLNVGAAFAALGDNALAIHCLRIAEPFIATDSDGTGAQRMRVLEDRLGEPSLAERRTPPIGP